MADAAIPLLPDAAGLDIAARTVLGEARGESREGKIGVLWDVMTRVLAASWWGRSHLAVCLWPHQFSCWNDSDPNRRYMLGLRVDDPDYLYCRELARSVFTGQVPDPTGGATHYFRPLPGKDMPVWASPERLTAVIGRHRFYRAES